MPRNRLPRLVKYYSPTGRRNYGRPLKRLLDTWDRNGSTSGPTPWQIYEEDYYYYYYYYGVDDDGGGGNDDYDGDDDDDDDDDDGGGGSDGDGDDDTETKK